MNRYRDGMQEIKADEEMRHQFIQQIQLKKNKIRRITLAQKVAVMSVVCLIVLISVLVGSTYKPDIAKQTFNGVIITAYASDGAAIEMKPNIELPLGQYSPLMSSVPGLPITLSAEEADDIVVLITEGNLSLWSPSSSKVISKGKKLHIPSGATVYWSPVKENSTELLTKKSLVSVIVYHNKIELGRRTIEIQAEDGFFYNGKLIEETS